MSTLFSAIGIYGTSVQEAMSNNVLNDPQHLSQAATASFDAEHPICDMAFALDLERIRRSYSPRQFGITRVMS
ncbi:hypothetical protein [Chromobacterium haemolyticum]|uniref:hypothetical protein n=1 Tax=Chromobacterium haemolyticum TaxID=394935 RepID=UPI001374A13E|nr:hypothetical protein [Chromobacterium haemolyticum]QOZ84810.1 hypothetical protein DXT74_17970 [Chromobacterium sp. Rain0013]